MTLAVTLEKTQTTDGKDIPFHQLYWHMCFCPSLRTSHNAGREKDLLRVTNNRELVQLEPIENHESLINGMMETQTCTETLERTLIYLKETSAISSLAEV